MQYTPEGFTTKSMPVENIIIPCFFRTSWTVPTLTVLQAAGVKVLLQTLPPFDRVGDKLATWLQVNDYVRSTLADMADGFFDVVPILIDGEEAAGKAKYNGHPNEMGCKAWADALMPVMDEFVRGLVKKR